MFLHPQNIKNELNMKSYKSVIVLALAAISLVACTNKEENKEVKEQLPIVEVQMVQEEAVPQVAEYTATVEAFKTNNIASSTGSRIKRILVDVGSRVRAGQSVVILDDVNIAQQQIAMANQKRDLDRAKELVRIGGGTQQTVDQLQAQYDASARALRNLQENTVLTSPISGVVTERNFDNGDLPSGQPILVIEQQQPLKVIVSVNERDFPYVKQGMPVQVKCDVYGDETFQGRVYLIHPSIDANNRTFQVEITIDNAGGKIHSGMFARVKFNYGTSNHIVVPDRAVIKQVGSGVRYVYVLNPDKTVTYTEVTLGQRLEDRYEIISGLANGAQVVTVGQSHITNGAKVEVKK